MTYHQITFAERYTLGLLRQGGLAPAAIARVLGRHRSTIGRELRAGAPVAGRAVAPHLAPDRAAVAPEHTGDRGGGETALAEQTQGVSFRKGDLVVRHGRLLSLGGEQKTTVCQVTFFFREPCCTYYMNARCLTSACNWRAVLALVEAECCALPGTDHRPTPLRQRAGRPQLRRGPLGSPEHALPDPSTLAESQSGTIQD